MDQAPTPEKLTWTSRQVRLRVLFTAFLMAFVCYGFFTWVLWPVKVLGDSMMPNFQNGERHFINKLSYRAAKPQRGDVIALYALNGDVYIKRVIGLPGETVSFPEGGVAINGQKLDEPYINTRIPLDRVTALKKPEKLKGTEYFVIGDNRATTVFGRVDEKDIIGKVMF